MGAPSNPSAVTGRPWRHWRLGRIVPGLTALVLLFFTLVLALGVRQYLLYRQSQQVVSAGDRLLFQFTTLKDHLNQSLVLAEEVNLRTLGDELQQLHQEMSHLAANPLVAGDLRILLPTRADLVGLEVQLRSIQQQPQKKRAETAALTRTLGTMNVALQQFRLGLGDHIQNLLDGLHKMIAGTLGLMLVLSCLLMYGCNYFLLSPLLTLCRATLGPETPATLGSLNQLLTQIPCLDSMTEIKVRQREVAETSPGQLRQQAINYRSAALGALIVPLSSELTGRLNGILNCTQTLLDLEETTTVQPLRPDILGQLTRAAQGALSLIAVVQRLGREQHRQTARLALRPLFTELGQLLEKSLQADAITLELPADCPYEVLLPAGDLWLVLLTLLHQGRMALKQIPPDPERAGSLRIALASGHRDDRLQLTLDNSTGRWPEDPFAAWPPRSFCAALLQHHQASLQEHPTDQGLLLFIDLPCRPLAA